MLAAIFVLGTDLLTAQFHVFMLDAPEAAVVAVSIWLILACDDFNRVGVSGVAGLAVGVGLLTKVQYGPFVVGILLMALLRGGWRNRRGLLAFAAAAVVVGIPWYVDHLSQFSTFLQVSTANPIVVPGDIPPTLSFANFTWYFWNILNSQLLVPLFALLVGRDGLDDRDALPSPPRGVGRALERTALERRKGHEAIGCGERRTGRGREALSGGGDGRTSAGREARVLHRGGRRVAGDHRDALPRHPLRDAHAALPGGHRHRLDRLSATRGALGVRSPCSRSV